MPDKPQPLDVSDAETLDLRGLLCPLPVLKTRKALDRMPAGGRLVVEATDPMSAIDLPHFCSEAGHRLVGAERTADTYRFLIERGSVGSGEPARAAPRRG